MPFPKAFHAHWWGESRIRQVLKSLKPKKKGDREHAGEGKKGAGLPPAVEKLHD